MGTALLDGVIRAGLAKGKEITVFDPSPDLIDSLQEKYGINAVANEESVSVNSDVVMLCVKPQVMSDVLQKIITPNLFISIAAGVKISSLKESTPDQSRIIRVMPNTPSLLGKGASVYCTEPNSSPEDNQVAEEIFSSVGTIEKGTEDQMDAITGLSGSGPAYVYTMIEAMADRGAELGLPKEMALALAAQTVLGAAEMVLQTDFSPAELREQVSSPGGTTVAGLKALEESGFRDAIANAIQSATERSIELGS